MILLILLPLRFQPQRWPKKALKSPYVGRGFLVTHRFPSGCGHSSSSSLAFVCSGQRQIPQTKPFLLSHLTQIFNLSCASALFLFVNQYHHANKILIISLKVCGFCYPSDSGKQNKDYPKYPVTHSGTHLH